MLRTPINVYPQNSDIDVNNNPLFSFMFSGNKLIATEYLIYDCMTEKPIGYKEWTDDDGTWHNQWWYYYSLLDKTKVYNNEVYTVSLNNLTQYVFNGRNYKWCIRMCHDIHDVLMMSGKIRKDSTAGNKIYVSKNLDNPCNGICEPIVHKEIEIGSQYLQIQYERHKILEIDNQSDENFTILTLDESFTELPKTSENYKIFSNYIISPFYYFRSRTTPTMTLSLELDSDSTLKCLATYSQNEYIPIKKFKVELYKKSDNQYELITESKYIFSANLEYKFSQFLEPNIEYKVKFIIINQDDTEISAEETITPTEIENDIIENVLITFNEKENCYKIEISTKSNISWAWYNVYRKTNNSSAIRMIGRCGGDTNKIRYIKDYLIGTNNNYTYYIVPSDINKNRCKTYISNIVTPKFEHWSLTSLSVDNRQLFEYDLYSTIETWQIEYNVENQSIVNNLNREIHVGSGHYPKISLSDVNYITGGFSGLISIVDCSNNKFEDDIEMVENWRKFISGNNPFLIKSPKGDVWFVHIHENPSTEYDSKTYNTTATISFAQTENLDNIIVDYEY